MSPSIYWFHCSVKTKRSKVMIAKPAKTLIISFNNNTPLGIQPREKPSESLKLRNLVKSEYISPKLVNSISLTPGWSGLEKGITQGKFCAPHRTLVKILCKQSENFVEGAVINYKVILSLSMRLQIVANHPLSPGLSSLWYLGIYITMQFGFSADSIFTWYTYVICTE